MKSQADTPWSDHQVIFGPYVAADDVHTLDGIVTDDKAEIASK